MKKKLCNLTIALTLFGVLITTGLVTLANSIIIDNENLIAKVGTISQSELDGDKKVIDITVTWGDFLDSYMEQNPELKYFNPRKDLGKEHRVRIVKRESPDDVYALITEVYDEKTGELLSSISNYKNN